MFPMRRRVTKGLPNLALVLALWLTAGGCGAGDILVATVRKPLGVFPEGTAFHVTRRSAPSDALLVATVSFETSTANTEATLNALRERVREAGGNLVADLRCTGEGIFLLPAKGASSSGLQITTATVRCEGRIYRVPIGRLPASRHPRPDQVESL